MLARIKLFFQKGLIRNLIDRVSASMGLKFMAAMTVVIAAVMVLGTVFVTRMLLDYQYGTIEVRGRETGMVLSKAIIDRLIASDHIGINMLVEDVVKSPGILSVVIVNTDGAPLTSARASFNRNDEMVKKVLEEEKTDNVTKLAAALSRTIAPIEVSVDVMLESTKLGEVRLAFSRAQVRDNAWKVVLLLLGTSVIIMTTLALLIYVMVRKMIIGPTSAAGAVALSVASGDLTKSVRVQSVDELGALGRSLNRMIIGLKGMIDRVREAAQKTESVWREVREISSEIASGSKEQAESVEEAASSVNEMHFTLKEIGGNVEDLYTTSERTSSSVIQMAASIDEVARTMAELSSSIEETSTAISQMSAAVRQIAENVEVLSSAAEETAASSTEISASVREVESNAKESALLAEAVADDAQQLGMLSINKTIEGMGRIAESANKTAGAVNRLGERAESIGSILTVIEDITDQTGLLALNAAILAAQAGEHGKGFAVVAAEIRELANRTAASTQEISALIASVQEDSREAVGVMQEEVAMVKDGVRLASAAGEALNKILARADQSRDMSLGISKAAAEQARGIRQVSDAIDKINEMAHQIARATNEQKTGSEQITRAGEKMRELTRFVKGSTDEQAKGGKDITAAVENMTNRIGMVNRATGEVQAGSDLIVKSIDRIKEIAKANAGLASGLNIATDVMARQSETLKKEIEKFST